MEGEVVIEVPARLDYLAVVRLVVTTAASLEPPLSESKLDDLRLAVSEACSNAIKAHARARRDEPVVVRCSIEPDRFVVEIRDRGAGFDPDNLSDLPAATDPERLKHEGGLGIPLIQVLTDDVSFAQTEDGMLVRMTMLRT